MITMHDALTATEFHENHEPADKIVTWRRNGATQTWKTRPDHFRIPVTYGLRSYGQIYHTDADLFHRADACPTRHVRVREDGAEFDGIVLALDNVNTIARVQVTRRGTSKHHVGDRINVDTTTITDL